MTTLDALHQTLSEKATLLRDQSGEEILANLAVVAGEYWKAYRRPGSWNLTAHKGNSTPLLFITAPLGYALSADELLLLNTAWLDAMQWLGENK